MVSMKTGNSSSVPESVLAGLTDCTELQLPLFDLFLIIYINAVVVKFGLITVIGFNPHQHTPMYYLFFNLSFIDVCYSSFFSTKLLMNFVSEKNSISYEECITQLFLILFFVIS